MKILKRIIIFIIMFFIMLSQTNLAVEQEEEIPETNYNIISEEEQEKLKEFVSIQEGYEKICIAEGIIFLIVIWVVIKTDAIEKSTKSVLLIAILAVLTYVLKFMLEGNILSVIDVFVQILGYILFAISAFFIYKNDNLLIYIPVYIATTYYAIREIEFINQNGLLKLLMIIAPFALYILGRMVNIEKERRILKPVKEKHPRNY